MMPDQAWREFVCSRCEDCLRTLRFMEGPICDACVDRSEQPILTSGYDRYAEYRSLESVRDRIARVQSLEFGNSPPTGRPPLLVNMVTRDIHILPARSSRVFWRDFDSPGNDSPSDAA